MHSVRRHTSSSSNRRRPLSSLMVQLVLLAVLGHSVLMAADAHAVALDHQTHLAPSVQTEVFSATEVTPAHHTGPCFTTSDAAFEGVKGSQQPDVRYATCLATVELEASSSSVIADTPSHGPGPPDEILALFQILRL